MIDLDEIISAVSCDEKLFSYILGSARKSAKSYGFPPGSLQEKNAIDDAIQNALINIKVVDIVQYLVEQKKKEYLRQKNKNKSQNIDDSFQENPEEVRNHIQTNLLKTFISSKEDDAPPMNNNYTPSHHFIEEEIKYQQSLAKSKSLLEQANRHQRESYDEYTSSPPKSSTSYEPEDEVLMESQNQSPTEVSHDDSPYAEEDSMLPSFSSTEPEDSATTTTRRMLKKLNKHDIPEAAVATEASKDLYNNYRYNGDEDFYGEDFSSTLDQVPSLHIDPDFLVETEGDSVLYRAQNYSKEENDSDESTVQATCDIHNTTAHFPIDDCIIFKDSDEKDARPEFFSTELVSEEESVVKSDQESEGESEEESEEESSSEAEEEDEREDFQDSFRSQSEDSVPTSARQSPRPQLVIDTEEENVHDEEPIEEHSESHYEDDFVTPSSPQSSTTASPPKPIPASSLYFFDSKEFAAELDAEESGKPRRHVHFEDDPIKEVFEYERIPPSLVPELFYSHAEETQFSINQSKEYSLAVREDMKWYDWILKQIDEGYDDDQVLAQVSDDYYYESDEGL